MKKLFNISFFYLILGLVFGVFYREFTKLNAFTGTTTLSTTHTHILILGFIFFLLLVVIDNNFNVSSNKYFNVWLITYNISFILFISTLAARGILQVLNKDFAGLSHIAGTSHVILGISFIWLMIMLKKQISNKIS